MKPSKGADRTERRARRYVPPPCEKCSKAQVKVVSRTPYVLYLRCFACAHVWSVTKPEVPPDALV
jgi:uncharacterized Zn finger protein